MQTMTGPAAPAPPYTRQALIELSQGMRRRFIMDIFLIPAVLIAAAWLVSEAMGVTGQTSMIAILFTTLASPIVAASVAGLRVHLRSPRCPGCAVRLVTTGGILRLRGDGCSHCGSLIVGPGPEVPPTLEAHARFMMRYDALARTHSRWTWISGILLALAAVGIFGLENGWLPQSLEPVVIGLGLAVAPAGFVAWLKGTRGAIRRAGLNCPTCNDPLVGGPGGNLSHHTLTTGTCPWCSAPVWS